MKKFFSVFAAVLFLCSAFVCAHAAAADTVTAEKPWYELSGENTVLTVRLPGKSNDGMDWEFEISNPNALELLTHEVIDDEGIAGSPTTYVASFFSMACAENTTSLILRYKTGNPSEAAFATRVLELSISADNAITIVSVLEQNKSADWLQYDADNFILTVTLPASESGAQQWDLSILDPAFFEPIACETENGFVGSFRSNLAGAGATELSVRNGNIIYTVNLIASETGELLVKWTEVFTVLTPEAAAK